MVVFVGQAEPAENDRAGEEFSCCLCGPLSVPTRSRGQLSQLPFLHSTTDHTSPPAWPHVCPPFYLQKCQDFYLLFFSFTAAITCPSLILILGYACPKPFLLDPKCAYRPFAY